MTMSMSFLQNGELYLKASDGSTLKLGGMDTIEVTPPTIKADWYDSLLSSTYASSFIYAPTTFTATLHPTDTSVFEKAFPVDVIEKEVPVKVRRPPIEDDYYYDIFDLTPKALNDFENFCKE